jgi:hypothetical protein
VLIDRIDMKKGKEKKLIRQRRHQVDQALARINVCIGGQLDEAERNTLAGVFAVEENALQLCEAGRVNEAVSLLKEQEGIMVPVAITILQRIAVMRQSQS